MPFLITGGILLVCLFFPPFIAVMLFAAPIWAAVDASSLQGYKYDLGGPKSGLSAFLWVFLLWIVGFPWYLVNRGKIKDGTALVKPEFQDDPPPDRTPERLAALQALQARRASTAHPAYAVPMAAVPMAPAAPAPVQPDTIEVRYEQIRRLGELRDKGILTEEEFAGEKRKILGEG